MIFIRILKLENAKQKNGVLITAVIGTTEFKQLHGNLDKLCTFSTQTVTEPASVTKTGARHSYAKYLLLPVTIRRQHKIDDYDFDDTSCGTIYYQDDLYILYRIPKKPISAAKDTTRNETNRSAP